MKKKRIATLLAGAMVLSLLGTTCAMAEDLYFVTGGPMGTYYAVGQAMTEVLNPLLPDAKLLLESSGASRANLEMIEEGDAQFATVQNDVMYYAAAGIDLFEGEEPFKNFSALAGIYDETIQIVTCDDSIQSVTDLKGKTVSIGDAGSGVAFNAMQILEAYEMTADDITVVNASFGDSAQGLEEGEIDAAFIVAGAPTTAVEDLAESTAIHFVQLDDAHIEALQQKYDFYTQTVIPAGTYQGVEEDAVTVSVRATLVASNEVSEETVYALLKALFENKDALAGKQAKFEGLSAEDAVKGMSVPLHAGAKKYYEEMGIAIE